MQARITRAKKKIADAQIPYRTPTPAELPERLESVFDTVQLVYNAGHVAPSPATTLMRADLADRAVQIARMLHELLPPTPKPAGCWRCCCSPTRAARRGSTLRRTGPARGTGAEPLGPRRDRRGPRAVAHRAAERSARPVRGAWRASRPCTPRHRPPATPTGRRSSSCTSCCCAAGRARSSRSTARSRSALRKGPRPGWPRWTRWPNEPELTSYPTCRGARRLPAPPRPVRCGGRGLPGGVAADRQRASRRRYLQRRLAEVGQPPQGRDRQ